MAFPAPVAADTTSGSVTSNSNSWTLTYPANIAVGDLLVSFVATDGGSTSQTYPSGWTSDFSVDGIHSDGTATLGIQWKVADGTESGTFSLSLGGSEQGVWRIIRIPASTWWGTSSTGVSPGGATNANSGSDNAPDPPSTNPSSWDVEDTLWIAVAGSDHGNTTYTGFPTGFFQEDLSTSGGHAQESGGANGAGMGVAYLQSAAASVDPSAFTTDASEGWSAGTIAVRPAAAYVPRHGFVNYQDPGVL